MRTNPHISILPEVFEDLSGIPAELSSATQAWEATLGNGPWAARVDAVLRVDERTFLVEFKKQYSSEHVAAVAHRWTDLKSRIEDPKVTPLLVVPYMGETARNLCRDAGIDWVDLSGNAEIHLPGLHISVLGRDNKFKRRGRPKSLFAPATSRISRALLLKPEGFESQRDLAAFANLSEGWVSRSVRRLEDAGFIEREDRIRLIPSEAGRLLDQWQMEYDFFDHEVHRAHVAIRDSQEMQLIISSRMDELTIQHAATGLGAAWLYSGHAAFRTVSLFVEELPSADDLSELGFRWVDSGSNLWLAIPNDDGVYMGRREVDGIPCVSPLQVYLDLQQHPERSKEAAEDLRVRFLGDVHE